MFDYSADTANSNDPNGAIELSEAEIYFTHALDALSVRPCSPASGICRTVKGGGGARRRDGLDGRKLWLWHGGSGFLVTVYGCRAGSIVRNPVRCASGRLALGFRIQRLRSSGRWVRKAPVQALDLTGKHRAAFGAGFVTDGDNQVIRVVQYIGNGGCLLSADVDSRL